MVTVKAGKFMMCICAYAIAAPDKSVFKGITSVEGNLKDFRDINALLARYPVFRPFDLTGMEVEQ